MDLKICALCSMKKKDVILILCGEYNVLLFNNDNNDDDGYIKFSA